MADFNSRIVALNGVSIALGSGAGKIATDDGTGLITWQGVDATSDLEGIWPVLNVKGSVLRDPNTVNLVESMPRYAASSTAIDMVSGVLRLNFFTPTEDAVCTSSSMAAGTTTGPISGATLIRWGFYTVDAVTGAGTLVCSIANDTTLFGTFSAEYERDFVSPSSYTFLAGQRYAGALLMVGGVTGTVRGNFATNAASVSRAPRLVGAITGQTNLPTTFTEAQMGTTNTKMPYFAAHA